MYLLENHKVGFQTEMKQSQYGIIFSIILLLYLKYTYFVVICESFHKRFICLQKGCTLMIMEPKN